MVESVEKHWGPSVPSLARRLVRQLFLSVVFALTAMELRVVRLYVPRAAQIRGGSAAPTLQQLLFVR